MTLASPAERLADGASSMGNLVLMCDAHHQQLHDGLITIRGVAPDLVFGMPVSSSWDWEPTRGEPDPN